MCSRWAAETFGEFRRAKLTAARETPARAATSSMVTATYYTSPLTTLVTRFTLYQVKRVTRRFPAIPIPVFRAWTWGVANAACSPWRDHVQSQDRSGRRPDR